ncbi:hypothetical protein QBD00_003190 [Ochrobactrum sp. AN78]|nr:hypothetical protein [Ochrobactrum sp. AN78]
MQWLQSILQQAPEIALFLSLAGGYALGKFNSGNFNWVASPAHSLWRF